MRQFLEEREYLCNTTLSLNSCFKSKPVTLSCLPWPKTSFLRALKNLTVGLKTYVIGMEYFIYLVNKLPPHTMRGYCAL